MMVRAAVLKMKDPRQIIKDMEKLDEMGMLVSLWPFMTRATLHFVFFVLLPAWQAIP